MRQWMKLDDALYSVRSSEIHCGQVLNSLFHQVGLSKSRLSGPAKPLKSRADQKEQSNGKAGVGWIQRRILVTDRHGRETVAYHTSSDSSTCISFAPTPISRGVFPFVIRSSVAGLGIAWHCTKVCRCNYLHARMHCLAPCS
jgi:hypothetical protein